MLSAAPRASLTLPSCSPNYPRASRIGWTHARHCPFLKYYKWSLSAYEVKSNCCLFERLFKVKKNGIFLFGIAFFVLEIFMFLYYANEESDDVIKLIVPLKR